MDMWHYADSDRVSQGPIDSETLTALYRERKIGPDTLVWREGMSQWQPLAAFAGELGIELAHTMPPPLPPAQSASPAAETPPHIASPSPTKALSGWAIAAIIAGVLFIVVVPLIGILAAISIPAYQHYTLRAQTAAAVAEAEALEAPIAEFRESEERCPVNGDDGFGTPDSYASERLQRVRIGHFDDGNCGIEAILTIPGQAKLDGKALWLDYDTEISEWHCSSEIEDRYLPAHCRG